MWEKNNNTSDNFTLSDIDMDDDVIKSLLEKDVNNSTNNSYRMKK